VRGSIEALLDGVAVQRLGPGDHFGDRSLLGGGTHHRTMVAHDHALLASLDRQHFLEFLGADLERRRRLEAMLAYRDALGRSSLLEGASPAEVDVLLLHMQLRHYDAGSVIAARGTPVAFFAVVGAGSAVAEGDDGRRERLGPGDVFGDEALLQDSGETAYDVTVVAGDGGCDVLAMSARDARDLLVHYFHRAVQSERLSHLRLDRHAAVAS
jgi:CRP-like cAMP-binding protein